MSAEVAVQLVAVLRDIEGTLWFMGIMLGCLVGAVIGK